MQNIPFDYCCHACHPEPVEGLSALEGQSKSNRRKLKTQIFLAMRLTAILLFATFLTASARSGAQTVTLHVKEAPLQQVLKAVEVQTGYQFFYKVSLEQKFKPVSIQLSNLPIQEALNKIFANQVVAYELVNKTIVIKEKDEVSIYVPPPPTLIDVKGKVVDENGKPVLATVQVKGTNRKISTNESGEFVLLNVEEDAVLIVTAVNIESFEWNVSGKRELNLTAKSKTNLVEEVTVEANTGYQKIKPNEVNGSLSFIDNATLNQQAGLNVINRLNGLTPSLLFKSNKSDVKSTTGITIRGESTINGTLDPLIILDNFPYEGDIANINPNDVENITILKDAAATSIYGARGGNGVIVITTKKGRFNQKMKISFNATTIITSEPDLFSTKQMNVSDYIMVEEFLFNRGYFNNDITNINRPALTPAVEIFLKRRNGQISMTDSLNEINTLKNIDSRDDYQKYILRNDLAQQYSLSLSGGSNNLSWLFSGGYDKTMSSLKEMSDKLNFRFHNSYKLSQRLQMSVSAYYSNANSLSGVPGIDQRVNNRMVPYLQLADPFGQAIAVNKDYRGGYTDTAGAGRLLNWKYYPLDDWKHDRTKSTRTDLTAQLSFVWRLSKSLTIESSYQHQVQASSSKKTSDLSSYYARDIINRFARLSRTTAPDTFRVPKGSILSFKKSNLSSKNFRTQLNFIKGWGKHNLSALGGVEIRENIFQGGESYTIYGFNENPITSSSVDYLNTYPTFVNGSSQVIPGSPMVLGTRINRFVSIYTNALYNFKERYSFSVSGRKDASNTFGLSTNDKWNPLWSFGAGWEISKESFYKVSWLPFLKFKISYGNSGNVDLSKTALPILSYQSSSSSPGVPFPTAIINNPNNPSLRWEKVNQLNIGFNFSTKNKTLVGSVEFYKKQGFDLYAASYFDYTAFGQLSEITMNVADMIGKGVDLSLSANILKGKIGWSSLFNYTYYLPKTSAYFTSNSDYLSLMLEGGPRIVPVIDKALYGIAAYKWAGLNSAGDPQGFVNGQISTNYSQIFSEASKVTTKADGNLIYKGSANPTHYGNLLQTLTWKRFSLNANITFKLGYFFRNEALSYAVLFSGIPQKEFDNRWQKPGDELTTNVPAMVYTNYMLNGQPVFNDRDNFYRLADIHVLRGDHIRLQFISLGYSVKPKFIRNISPDINLYINASSLGILWRANQLKIDPDYPNSNYKNPKSFALGMRITF